MPKRTRIKANINIDSDLNEKKKNNLYQLFSNLQALKNGLQQFSENNPIQLIKTIEKMENKLENYILNFNSESNGFISILVEVLIIICNCTILERSEWPKGDSVYRSGSIILHFIHFIKLETFESLGIVLHCYVHCRTGRQNLLSEKD
jgi:hypothetical protein